MAGIAFVYAYAQQGHSVKLLGNQGQRSAAGGLPVALRAGMLSPASAPDMLVLEM
jgi:hypothetical protein